MNLENNMPAFKMPEFKGTRNPLTNEGMRALAIVLGVIVVIAGVVYVSNFGKRKESIILSSPQPTITTETPIVTPLVEEATSSASPSSTRKIQRPTVTPILTP